MEQDDMGTDLVQDGGIENSLPKPVVKDELAYMIVASGLAAYAETNDIRILCAMVAVYAIGYFGLRINAQAQETKRKVG